MTTKLVNDHELPNEALKLGSSSTEKETIAIALKETTPCLRQQQILELFGNLPADDNHDYKKGREQTKNYFHL